MEDFFRNFSNPVITGRTSKVPYCHKFEFDFKNYNVKQLRIIQSSNLKKGLSSFLRSKKKNFISGRIFIQ